jgi:hypothetical protein
MPLARCALYAQGVDVYIAPTYDAGERWIATLQHIAREGGCWVLGSGCAFQARHIPDALPGRADLHADPDEWVNAGDSLVVAPGGKIVAGPLHNELGILYAEIELERIGPARRSLDTVGHYARPDISGCTSTLAGSNPWSSTPRRSVTTLEGSIRCTWLANGGASVFCRRTARLRFPSFTLGRGDARRPAGTQCNGNGSCWTGAHGEAAARSREVSPRDAA